MCTCTVVCNSVLLQRQPQMNVKDTYYIFNHVHLTITYHPSAGVEEWSQSLPDDLNAGRILSVKVNPLR